MKKFAPGVRAWKGGACASNGVLIGTGVGGMVLNLSVGLEC